VNTIAIDTNSYREVEKMELPAHLEMLGGCLSGVAEGNDEKLNYLLENYK